jgi:hypothetical protein
MKKYFGCDAHKNYSIFTSLSEDGTKSTFFRVENNRSEYLTLARFGQT